MVVVRARDDGARDDGARGVVAALLVMHEEEEDFLLYFFFFSFLGLGTRMDDTCTVVEETGGVGSSPTLISPASRQVTSGA